MALDEATLKLLVKLVRHFKGAALAYEEWVKAQLPPTTIELDPDPVKHFEKQFEERIKK